MPTDRERAENVRRVQLKLWPNTPEQRARDLYWHRFWTGCRTGCRGCPRFTH